MRDLTQSPQQEVVKEAEEEVGEVAAEDVAEVAEVVDLITKLLDPDALQPKVPVSDLVLCLRRTAEPGTRARSGE